MRRSIITLATAAALCASQSYAQENRPFTEDDRNRATSMMEGFEIINCWKDENPKQGMPYFIRKYDDGTVHFVNAGWKGEQYGDYFVFNDEDETLRLSPNKLVYVSKNRLEQEECLLMTETLTEVVAVLLNNIDEIPEANVRTDELSSSDRAELELLRKEFEMLRKERDQLKETVQNLQIENDSLGQELNRALNMLSE